MDLFQSRLGQKALKNDKKVHGPWQDNEGSVGPNCIHSALCHHLRIQRRKQLRKPHSHALEHLCVCMEGKNCSASHSRTVQQAQRQALHEGIRRGFGRAIVDGSRDGGEGENGVNAHHVAVAQLQHARQKCFRGPELSKGVYVLSLQKCIIVTFH